MDSEGQFIIKPQFDEASEFSNGLALVSFKSSFICGFGSHNWGYIDSQGKLTIQPESSYLKSSNLQETGSFSEGFAVIYVETYKKYGFIDTQGKIVIKPKYDKAEPFSEGLAPVMVGERWGYIDRSGAMVVAPTFNSVSEFREGIAAVEVDGQVGFIATTGRIIVSPRFELEDTHFPRIIVSQAPVGERLIAVKSDGKWGFIDSSGRFIVEPAIPAERLSAVITRGTALVFRKRQCENTF